MVEIAELSNELQQHLMEQTDLTDRLFEEATFTTATVEKGNTDLVKARKRQKATTKYIVGLLLLMSFVLLFLDYYN